MADFSLQGGLIEGSSSAWSATATGVVLTSGANHTKGAWVQMIASTVGEGVALDVHLQRGNGTQVYAVDVAINDGGTRVIIAADLLWYDKDFGNSSLMIRLPVSIPDGTRLDMRVQSNTNLNAIEAHLKVWLSTFQAPAGAGTTVTYGFTAATTNGVDIDPGAIANTKGAYSEITASTNEPLAGFYLLFAPNDANGTWTDARWLIDVAIGGAGSEVVISADNIMLALVNEVYTSPGHIWIPIDVAEGSRIAIRSQSTENDSNDRLLEVVLIGVVG